MLGEAQPRLGASMIPYVSVASSTITRTWPTGSKRRGRGARDSGTKRSVSTIAASPTGTLIRKIDRQPTADDERAADDRPERHRDPEHGAPDADRLRPLARVGEGVGDDRHRDRVEHRAADRLQHAERDQQLDARRQAAQQRADA